MVAGPYTGKPIQSPPSAFPAEARPGGPPPSPPTTTAQPVAPPAGGGQLAPTEAGYASVHMEAWPHHGKARLRLKVNGLLVGAYDTHVSIPLDPFLKPGVVNTVVFSFNRPGGEVHLSVKVPGSDKWTVVLKFVASKDTLEDSFEVPFVGAKER